MLRPSSFSYGSILARYVRYTGRFSLYWQENRRAIVTSRCRGGSREPYIEFQRLSLTPHEHRSFQRSSLQRTEDIEFLDAGEIMPAGVSGGARTFPLLSDKIVRENLRRNYETSAFVDGFNFPRRRGRSGRKKDSERREM